MKIFLVILFCTMSLNSIANSNSLLGSYRFETLIGTEQTGLFKDETEFYTMCEGAIRIKQSDYSSEDLILGYFFGAGTIELPAVNKGTQSYYEDVPWSDRQEKVTKKTTFKNNILTYSEYSKPGALTKMAMNIKINQKDDLLTVTFERKIRDLFLNMVTNKETCTYRKIN